MKRIRWGILGCAAIADRAVIPAIQASLTGELIGIASRDENKAKAKAEQFNIPKSYGSYEAMLADPEIDAIYIPLPNHMHKEWTIAAANTGKHILCEKPLALNAAEAQEMVDYCKEAGVHLAEAFMYRHHPRIARVKEIIASGEIGELRAIRGVFTYNGAESKGDIRHVKAWGGGGLYDVGVYPLSAARLIMGIEPEAVTVRALFSPEHGDVDMMASGLVEFPGNVALTFDCGMWAAFRNELEIVGTAGTITLKPSFLPSKENDDITIQVGDAIRKEGPYGVDAYVAQSDQFARVVWGEEAPAYPAQDAVASMKLVDACIESARSRRRIVL
ncbi:Gfo/Idh/MocA family protein [Cohnella cholangitidis]|uniref:Gfo/Idh/MocA family oxidoreductase n=1 Tax=Cohnella cholangitidis TaxID=2598458 RepID=A0A7G5C2G0_9BACL|nr:Gfo/Idh/MocA family oxidoreductase [Cohnella cholangitidis]QMV43394.1 Gfo/Idh/MocA family oxidoreductase [Cohnella cholangitidis]